MFDAIMHLQEQVARHAKRERARIPEGIIRFAHEDLGLIQRRRIVLEALPDSGHPTAVLGRVVQI